MAFLLNQVVPWGRTLDEYRKMFGLTDEDMKLRIAGFGDGPASFNYELTKKGGKVTSYDIVYRFLEQELKSRIMETRDIVMKQMEENRDNYIWTDIKSLEELERLRLGAMDLFLSDYENGRKEGRYVYHALPERLPVEDKCYDIGLSSHFLLMYDKLGYYFHIAAIGEMLRVCHQLRIFPICDLDGNKTELADSVIRYFDEEYQVEVVKSDYCFQKGGDRLLIIKEK